MASRFALGTTASRARIDRRALVSFLQQQQYEETDGIPAVQTPEASVKPYYTDTYTFTDILLYSFQIVIALVIMAAAYGLAEIIVALFKWIAFKCFTVTNMPKDAYMWHNQPSTAPSGSEEHEKEAKKQCHGFIIPVHEPIQAPGGPSFYMNHEPRNTSEFEGITVPTTDSVKKFQKWYQGQSLRLAQYGVSTIEWVKRVKFTWSISFDTILGTSLVIRFVVLLLGLIVACKWLSIDAMQVTLALLFAVYLIAFSTNNILANLFGGFLFSCSSEMRVNSIIGVISHGKSYVGTVVSKGFFRFTMFGVEDEVEAIDHHFKEMVRNSRLKINSEFHGVTVMESQEEATRNIQNNFMKITGIKKKSKTARLHFDIESPKSPDDEKKLRRKKIVSDIASQDSGDAPVTTRKVRINGETIKMDMEQLRSFRFVKMYHIPYSLLMDQIISSFVIVRE